MSKTQDNSRSLTIRSSQELTKIRQSSALVDKHLSGIASNARDVSKCIASIEFKGGLYEGEVFDGIPHGYGALIVPSDEVGGGYQYVGGWQDGLEHGRGTFTFDDGEEYAGEWKDGVLQGQGTCTWADGREYVGEWKDGVLHGQGTYTWPDGSKYVGEWKYGRRNGAGIFTDLEGEELVGEWRDDNLITILGDE